ncbi:MAG: glycoside hydrolase family 3 N-terminal domain-containing protein [Ktedonobacterales bacterium]
MRQRWRPRIASGARGWLWQATLLLTVLVVAACAGGKSVTHPTATGAAGTQTPNNAPGVPAAVRAALAAQEHEALMQQTAAYDVSQMSLDEQIGQMFLIETYYKTYTPDIDNMVVGMHAGALIIYGKNMQDPAQLQAYIAAIQAHVHIPLLVTMDEEGGLVDRLGFLHFDQPLPAAQDVGASGNAQNAYNEGMQAAQEMTQLGINTDLAPVADVRGSAGSIETTRLYSSDPTVVTQMAGAFLNGLQSHGVAGTLKHWPGIGGVILDPHKALPTITDSQAQLESTNFATFRQLVAENPGMIMVTHVLVNAIDPNMPATLSPKLVNGVLRGELGYQGVVMTDSLYMQGIALRYTLPQAGVLAIEAGDDLLEGAFDTNSMSGMIAAIHAAIDAGQITPARIAQSAQRILALKIRFGLLPIRDARLLHNGSGVTGYADYAPFASAIDGDLPRMLWMA